MHLMDLRIHGNTAIHGTHPPIKLWKMHGTHVFAQEYFCVRDNFDISIWYEWRQYRQSLDVKTIIMMTFKTVFLSLLFGKEQIERKNVVWRIKTFCPNDGMRTAMLADKQNTSI